MFFRTALISLLSFSTSAIAQEATTKSIVEGTRALEAKYSCRYGKIIDCLISEGFDCEPVDDAGGSVICSTSGVPVFEIYEQEPKKWIVEVLFETPKHPR